MVGASVPPRLLNRTWNIEGVLQGSRRGSVWAEAAVGWEVQMDPSGCVSWVIARAEAVSGQGGSTSWHDVALFWRHDPVSGYLTPLGWLLILDVWVSQGSCELPCAITVQSFSAQGSRCSFVLSAPRTLMCTNW